MSSSASRVGSWPLARSLLRRQDMDEETGEQQDPHDDLRATTMRGRLSSRLMKSSQDSIPSRLSKLRIPTIGDSPTQVKAFSDFEKGLALSETSSASSSFKWDDKRKPADGQVAYHSEVLTHVTIWKKVTEYLVLTDLGIYRCPNRKRAAVVFPEIAMSRLHHSRTNSSRSSGSHEIQTPRSSEGSWDLLATGTRIDLEDVFAVYNLYDTKPSFAVALHWLDPVDQRPHLYTFQLPDPDVKDTWISLISQHSRTARAYPEIRSIWLEDPDLLESEAKVFRVVRNVIHSLDGQGSDDSIEKPSPQLEYLVLGENKIHFAPVGQQINHKSYGLAAITSIEVFGNDDRFRLTTRIPLQSAREIECASVDSIGICRDIISQLKYLRPNWKTSPWKLDIPQLIRRRLSIDKSYDCGSREAFDRVLRAYCVAYSLDRDQIRYEINSSDEEAPMFRLIRSAGRPYTVLQLLAVVRSLRYLDSFVTISFAEVCLDGLNRRVEHLGKEHLDWTIGIPKRAELPFKYSESTILTQEIAAIACTNRKLLRLDFSNTITPSSSAEHSCSVLKALYPLCNRECTNVEWLNLHGIHLNNADVEYLHHIVDDRKSHFRGLDLSKTYLGPQTLTNIVRALGAQESTLEVLNISNNGAGLDEYVFDSLGQKLPYLRIVKLANLKLTPLIQEPLISLATLKTWRLQELDFSGTAINASTVHALCLYLRCAKSQCLRVLRMNSAEHTGTVVARLLESMAKDDGKARDLHFSAGANDIENGFQNVLLALRNGWAPKSLSLANTRFSDERRLGQFFQALDENTTIQDLDISNLHLIYGANLSKKMFESIQNSVQHMVENDWTLRSLDMSSRKPDFGNHKEHNVALQMTSYLLRGLRRNKTLKKLDISGHTLSDNDAEMLHRTIIFHPNLTEVYCEEVIVSLEGFKRLVDAAQDSPSLTFLSDMEFAKEFAVEEFFETSQMRRFEARRNSRQMHSPENRRSFSSGMISTITGRLRSNKGKVPQVQRPSLPSIHSDLNPQQQERAAWEVEQARLAKCLERNRRRANGENVDDDEFLGKLDFDDFSDDCNDFTKKRNDSGPGEASMGKKHEYD